MIDCFLVLYTFFGLRFFEILCCVCIACCDCIVFYFLVIKKPTELGKKKKIKTNTKREKNSELNWNKAKLWYGKARWEKEKQLSMIFSYIKTVDHTKFFFFPSKPFIALGLELQRHESQPSCPRQKPGGLQGRKDAFLQDHSRKYSGWEKACECPNLHYLVVLVVYIWSFCNFFSAFSSFFLLVFVPTCKSIFVFRRLFVSFLVRFRILFF